MSEDPDSPIVSVTDQVIADLLEDGVPSEVAHIDKSRAAELLWLQSLLNFALHPQPTRQAQRIDRVMAAIRETLVNPEPRIPIGGPAPTTPSRASTQNVAWLTAAVALVCVGLWMQVVNPRRQAHAAVDQIRQSAALAEDREYLVTLSFGVPLEATDQNVRARLFVRGGEAFVANAPAMLRPGEVWFGRDRHGAWFKPAIGPVLAGPGAVVMQQRFLRNPGDDAPYLQLTTIMNRLADHYDIRLLPKEVPARGSLAPVSACQHVRGSLVRSKSLPDWFPDQIDIHAEPENGTIMRLLLVWNHEIPSHLKQVQFDFVEQSHKPDSWYRAEGKRE